MQPGLVPRQYILLKAPSAPVKSVDALHAVMLDLMNKVRAPSRLSQSSNVWPTSAPSGAWTLNVVDFPDRALQPPEPDENVLGYEFANQDLLTEFRSVVSNNIVDKTFPGDGFTAIGADPGGSLGEHSCPAYDGFDAFGSREDAKKLLGLSHLPPPLPGQPKVNVVIIDQGLRRTDINAVNWGGGWDYRTKGGVIKAGSGKSTSHGMLIARNILDIAPDAILYDVPVIPPERISEVEIFARDADAMYERVLAGIDLLKQHPRWQGPWIFVNSWSIFDRASELPLGDYSEDTHKLSPPFRSHPLNERIAQAVAKNVDVVFAAGNCGQFCPSARCGSIDRGPGRSIWGANSHPAVITVGAVLTNGTWLGYSSEGPGQPLLDPQKPDLCAPSHFRDLTDANRHNTGTSTACAVTAGVIAALRATCDLSAVSPARLKLVLQQTAIRPAGASWNGRLGCGILSASTAYNELIQHV